MIPDRSEFRRPDERLVRLQSEPDEQGRQHFTAFWLDSYLPPTGVRGQCFFGRISDLLHGPVRVIGGAQ